MRPLWRLEWWRLVRTHRALALVAVYLFFGLTAAPLARYAGELLERFGGGVQVIVPTPRPVDSFTNYLSNANQLGLLVYTLVVSSALAVDAQREMAVFLRTRVRRYRDLLVAKYVLNVAIGCGAFLLGVAAAWYGTVILLGSVVVSGVLVGSALVVVYLAWVASVAALLGARLHSVVTTAIGTLAVALVLGLGASIEAVARWLPSHLVGSLTSLVIGGDVTDFVPALVVTVVTTVGLLALAVRFGASREL